MRPLGCLFFCEGAPAIQAENKRAARFELVLGHNESAFLFLLIASHVAELTRPFDEAALPVRAFLNGCSLVAERVNRLPGQIRGLASASSFGGLRWRGGAKGPFDESPNSPGSRRSVGLATAPFVDTFEQGIVTANPDCLAPACSWATTLFG